MEAEPEDRLLHLLTTVADQTPEEARAELDGVAVEAFLRKVRDEIGLR